MSDRIYGPLAYRQYRSAINDRPRNSHFFFWCFMLFAYVALLITVAIWLFRKPKTKPEYIPPTLNPLGRFSYGPEVLTMKNGKLC